MVKGVVAVPVVQSSPQSWIWKVSSEALPVAAMRQSRLAKPLVLVSSKMMSDVVHLSLRGGLPRPLLSLVVQPFPMHMLPLNVEYAAPK